MINKTKVQSGGGNLSGISQYNERLVLQHIRRAGSLTKADIARLTQLSPQTASVIINRLIKQQLLYKKARIQGKVGQPAIPIALNPEGAYSFGVKIGRRGLDIVLINFTGDIIKRLSYIYDYPDPNFIFPTIEQALNQLQATLSLSQRERLLGIGIASPYSLGGWQQEADIPLHITQAWNNVDVKQQIQTTQMLPVWFVNDATAACIASLECANSPPFNTYLYIFVGTFIGGGIIMDRTLYNGHLNNAGAIGSMPLPSHYAPTPTTEPTIQLLNCASRYLLNNRYQQLGLNPDATLAQLAKQTTRKNSKEYQIFAAWLNQVSPAIAYAITTATSIIDFEGVVIDGLLPHLLTQQLSNQVEIALKRLDLEGLIIPNICSGHLGNDARALGGAHLAFYTNYAPDRNILTSTRDHHLHVFQGN